MNECLLSFWIWKIKNWLKLLSIILRCLKAGWGCFQEANQCNQEQLCDLDMRGFQITWQSGFLEQITFYSLHHNIVPVWIRQLQKLHLSTIHITIFCIFHLFSASALMCACNIHTDIFWCLCYDWCTCCNLCCRWTHSSVVLTEFFQHLCFYLKLT